MTFQLCPLKAYSHEHRYVGNLNRVWIEGLI